jgi:hypothetical protein
MGPWPELTIYNLTLCLLQSRLQHIYHGQPYASVDLIPQSGTLDLASETQHAFGAMSIRPRPVSPLVGGSLDTY